MAALTTKPITTRSDMVAPSFVAAAGGGDTFRPSDRSFLVVRTTSNAITVTIAVPGTLAYDSATNAPDLAISIGTSSERWIGPLTPAYFADPSTGIGSITYSGVTGVTVGVYSV